MSTVLDQAGQTMRERILDDRFVASLYAQLPAGARIRTPGELDASLESVLSRHVAGTDVHVFAYGSLMWNPALEHAGIRPAKVHGWHRSFCLRSIIGRGSEQQPGLMLALDRGGACHGVLLRIEAHRVREELRVLWRREMFTEVYEARWVTACADATAAPAIAFAVNRSHPRYTKGLPVEEMARMISTGTGSLGSCREYFDATLDKLQALGIRDAGMERLRAALIRASTAAG
ncbi:gamma-glutamylcyclotransferase [Variovorax paradoxus]|nr:gamma-glutamylcyclotransferase [Variovorax paradoxus]